MSHLWEAQVLKKKDKNVKVGLSQDQQRVCLKSQRNSKESGWQKSDTGTVRKRLNHRRNSEQAPRRTTWNHVFLVLRRKRLELPVGGEVFFSPASFSFTFSFDLSFSKFDWAESPGSLLLWIEHPLPNVRKECQSLVHAPHQHQQELETPLRKDQVNPLSLNCLAKP